MKYIIYGLTDPRNGEVRYVGRSSSGLKRAKTHLVPGCLQRDRSYKARWIRSLLRTGLQPGVVILEEVGSADDLSAAERHWIAESKSLGCRLTNMTEGGEGLSGMRFSREHRRKIARANRGRRLTEEHKKKLSESRKTDSCLRASRANIRKAIDAKKGVRRTRKFRKMMSRVHRGKKVPEHVRNAVSKANSIPIMERSTGRFYPSAIAAAEELGLCYRSIIRVLNGRARATHGYTFEKLSNIIRDMSAGADLHGRILAYLQA